jgi:hypothetical protein
MPVGPGGAPDEAVQVTKLGGTVPFESLDGRYLYYYKGTAPQVWRVPAEGGQETPVLESVTFMNFAVTDQGIYFIPEPDAQGRSIRFLSFAAGASRPIAAIGRSGHRGLAVSPDGQSILYTQIDQEGSDLMLVEAFR